MRDKKSCKRDIVFIAAATVILLIVFIISRLIYSRPGDIVRVEYEGRLVGEYALAEDKSIYIPDEENTKNILNISGGEVYMSEADCPDKLCIKQGRIKNGGESIVCLPNSVVITVISDSEAGYDTIVR